ncbi:peptidase inhibitor family I36 protein [Streptomyces sp. 3214.6]|uniref:peptidase inhibitor family I36 protein n=1 Tax=Streptomyces sp. 3214.6 TaxID=1882757 RepID=UPI00090C3149|nr:peptidase inhibitor family I36 protein [Streptomyces sp. 3214.6]SHI09177.1 Peptidase inhibitor family I36 [Streptomyces sp. 3214.6]
MRMTKKFAALASGVLMTGGLLAGSAGAAQAAPSASSDCPAGWFCVWAGQNYTGHMQKISGTNRDLTQYSVFQSFKSWYNHGNSCDLKWYSERDYGGSSSLVYKGYKTSTPESHYIKSNTWVNCS